MLFTDLVGSTALRQAVGDDAADDLRRSHDRVLRDAVAAHGGHEVKGTGDGLMIVFDSAVEAAALLVRRGDPSDAQRLGQLLRECLDAATEMGMTRVVDQTRSLAAAAGVTLD